jgi:hypothetical protein
MELLGQLGKDWDFLLHIFIAVFDATTVRRQRAPEWMPGKLADFDEPIVENVARLKDRTPVELKKIRQRNGQSLLMVLSRACKLATRAGRLRGDSSHQPEEFSTKADGNEGGSNDKQDRDAGLERMQRGYYFDRWCRHKGVVVAPRLLTDAELEAIAVKVERGDPKHAEELRRFMAVRAGQ